MNKGVLYTLLIVIIVAISFVYVSLGLRFIETEIPKAITIIDSLNRTVTFKNLPMKIVVASDTGGVTIVEILYMFRTSVDKVIAMDSWGIRNNPLINMLDPNLKNKILFEKTPTVEEIIKLQPDLVITRSYMAASIGKQLESVGVKLIYLDLETPEAFFKSVRILGKVLGEENRAEELVSYMNGIITGISSRISGIPNKPKVLFLWYTVKAYRIPASGFLQNLLIELAGGISLSREVSGIGFPRVSPEQIVVWNPDIIFVTTYSDNPSQTYAVNAILNDYKLSMVKAVKENRVYPVPGIVITWDAPGTRWPLCIAYMASMMYPNIFGDINVVKSFAVSYYMKIYEISREIAEALVEREFKF
ncbi:MAG: ABC transporter substrate-binding protein [Candidatus Methanomethylicia archaeon]|nr:ABC transporter substrate-binding protein [Candidatus Methanomethylicia archaeon]MCX8168911.1 ABC transporter substrate-binding protein [Candidatus Methanomethylicia archaeon]